MSYRHSRKYLSFVSYCLCRALGLPLSPRRCIESRLHSLRWFELVAMGDIEAAWHGHIARYQRAVAVDVAIVDIVIECYFWTPHAMVREEEVHIVAFVRMQAFCICSHH